MYYIVHSAGEAKPLVYASVVESADGINWSKPELNIFKDYNLKINNVVIIYNISHDIILFNLIFIINVFLHNLN